MTAAIIHVMSQAAIKAGRGILRDFGEIDQLQISRKGVSNFVTATDKRTEKTLVDELQKARPEFGFLLEESGEIKGKDATHRWIIDPLDGTNNFIHAIPYFCISIALEQVQKNGRREIICGVIYDPIHNDLFTAQKGAGALLNNRRLTVSKRTEIDTCMVAACYVKTSEEAALVKKVSDAGICVRHSGASALDLAYVAAGRYDAAWFTRLQPWDVAAGLLILTEAGGKVTNLQGQDAAYLQGGMIASNQLLHGDLVKLLAVA